MSTSLDNNNNNKGIDDEENDIGAGHNGWPRRAGPNNL
jgi:hypothetical protein